MYGDIPRQGVLNLNYCVSEPPHQNSQRECGKSHFKRTEIKTQGQERSVDQPSCHTDLCLQWA